MSGVASESQARRCCEQIFAPALLPPHHLETIVYQGSIRWAIMLGLELCIMPIGTTDHKKVVRFKVNDITRIELIRKEHFSFADREQTERSAKVVIVVEEPERKSSGGSGGNSPLGRVFAKSLSFGVSSRPISHERKGSTDSTGSASSLESLEVSGTNMITREEYFYIFDPKTKLFEYLTQTFYSLLMCKAYGWKRIDERQQNKVKVKSLYTDLVQEIRSAQSLQDRVDLLDELALASRFNLHLKRLILFQAPPLLPYLVSELRKLTLDNWRGNADLAQRFGRAEAVQYISVLLECVHKTLFLSWPLFATLEGKACLKSLLTPKEGSIQQLVSAILAPLVTDEELKSASPFKATAIDVMNMVVAVLYQISQLFLELQVDREAPRERRMELYVYIVEGVQGNGLERRIKTMMSGMKMALLGMPVSPLRTVTLHHYAYVVHLLCKYPSTIRDVMSKNHQEVR